MPTQECRGIAFSPDGKVLLIRRWDNSIELWRIQNRKRIPGPRVAPSDFTKPVFSPNGSIVAYRAPEIGKIHLWDWAKKRLEASINAGILAQSMAFSPDGKMLAVGSVSDNSLRVFDVASGTKLKTFIGHLRPVLDLAFSPDGLSVASTSADLTVKVWDLSAEAPDSRVIRSPRHVASVAINRDGTLIAAAFRSTGDLAIWETDSGIRLHQWESDKRTEKFREITAMEFSPNGKQLATVSRTGRIVLWDVDASAQGVLVAEEDAELHGLDFSSDGRFLAYCGDRVTAKGERGLAKVWDRISQREVFSLDGLQMPLLSIRFSADGQRLITSGYDRQVVVWDTATKERIAVLNGHKFAVSQVLFNEDANAVISGSLDGTIRLWDVSQGVTTNLIEAHSQGVRSLAAPATPSRLASISEDQTVRVWNTESGREMLSFVHSGRQVKFSHDGSHLVVGGDKGIAIWDARPWTPEIATQSKARGLLKFLMKRENSLEKLQQRIRQSQSVRQEVKNQALEWSERYWNSFRGN